MEKQYSSSDLTRMQELGSAWIFRRTLKDNYRYKKWEDIEKDPKYKELGGPKGVYPAIDDTWKKTFFLQQEKMLEEFSNPKFTEFNREYGFMKFITNLVKQKYGIVRKDSWDPADIWCIKDEKKVIAEIEKVTSNKKYSSINELNILLRTLFKKRIVVGVSLKKISGKQAKYEEINVLDGLEYNTKENTFNVTKLKIDLSLRPGKDIKLNTQDTSIFLDAIEDNKKITYKYQITTISSSRFNNLKWEPTATSSAAARLGKAPVEKVIQILKDNKINFSNSNIHYPRTAADFKKKQTEFVKMFNMVKTKKVETVIKSDKDFVNNITKVFSVSPQLANTKLMQLTFLYELIKKPKKTMDTIMTKITLMAQKKGKEFGPFGKLY
jgi:hypothetical protein